MTREAAVALTAEGSRHAGALTAQLVAERPLGTLGVAGARCKNTLPLACRHGNGSISIRRRILTFAAVGAELERRRGAAVAAPAHHVGAALTLTPAGVAHGAEGALGVTLAFWEMESEQQANTKSPGTQTPVRAAGGLDHL